MASNLVRRRQPARLLARKRAGWRDWASIEERPARLIADRLLAHDVAHYVCFRAVCVSWFMITDDPKWYSVLDPRFHPSRWILLPEAPAARGGETRRRMLNLTSGAKITLDLPDLASENVVVAPGPGGSPGGVLVLMDELSLVVRLLNPLTGQCEDLPSVASVLSRKKMGRLDKKFFDLFKVTGAGFAGDSTVVLHFGWDNRLVSTRLGDDHWEVISDGSLLCTAFHFYGKVYFANWYGLMVVHVDNGTPPRLVLAAEWPSNERITLVHMADNSGELLVVANKVDFQEGDDYTVDFNVLRLDADAGALVPVSNLGGDNRALFVGDYGGTLVASAKCITHNAIYFQHDRDRKFYVRRISNGRTIYLLLNDPPGGGSFVDDLKSHVAWNGRKTRVAPAVSTTTATTSYSSTR